MNWSFYKINGNYFSRWFHMILHAISGEAPQFIAFSDKLLTNQECKSLTSVKRGRFNVHKHFMRSRKSVFTWARAVINNSPEFHVRRFRRAIGKDFNWKLSKKMHFLTKFLENRKLCQYSGHISEICQNVHCIGITLYYRKINENWTENRWNPLIFGKCH